MSIAISYALALLESFLKERVSLAVPNKQQPGPVDHLCSPRVVKCDGDVDPGTMSGNAVAL